MSSRSAARWLIVAARPVVPCWLRWRRLMPSPTESRAALQLLTGAAVATTTELLSRVRGTPEMRRLALLDGVPDLIGYYSEGSAALAADFYEEERELARVTSRFVPELVVTDRVVKQRRGIAWAAEPLFVVGDDAAVAVAGVLAASRLAEVVQLEVAKPFRDTILSNRVNDPASAGWRRITNGGCKLCRLLADRGVLYRDRATRFAAHPNCNCSVQPVFGSGDFGEEASVLQYVASQRKRTPAQQAKLRAYLNDHY